MKKCKLIVSVLVMSICIFFSISKAIGQESSMLSIGDAAPPLKYSKWIKGEPVKSLTGDQLFVLEFWATWCGPCKLAMPHLTKLQHEYKGKVNFIGVGVWEKVPAGTPYESSLTSVEKFVKGNDANMGYSVIADNNEQFMGNKWLKAAGENGIPSTFIVKDNKIMWIGHPNSLDTIIPKILEGRYDMEAFKNKFHKSAESSRKQTADFMAVFKPIEEAITAKEYTKAFELMDKLKTEQPNFKPMMESMKFRTLLSFDQKKAREFAQSWQKDQKSAPSLILGDVYNKEGLAPETYLWAVANFGNTDAVTNPIIFDALATCCAKGSDYKSAVQMQEKALNLAAKALKEGSMVGTVMDYTVKEYENKLKNYKSHL